MNQPSPLGPNASLENSRFACHFTKIQQTWRGKRFETMVHIAFSILWLTLCVVFLIVALG